MKQKSSTSETKFSAVPAVFSAWEFVMDRFGGVLEIFWDPQFVETQMVRTIKAGSFELCKREEVLRTLRHISERYYRPMLVRRQVQVQARLSQQGNS